VQRAFVRAFTNLDKFREDSTLSTWVTRVAINEALMLLRQRGTPSGIFQAQNEDVSETQELDAADARPNPEQAHAQNELRNLVSCAVSRLRGKLRSVVLLRELQGLSNAETARHLGLTVSAVKGRAFQARRHLRRHLTHKNGLRYSAVVIGS